MFVFKFTGLDALSKEVMFSPMSICLLVILASLSEGFCKNY